MWASPSGNLPNLFVHGGQRGYPELREVEAAPGFEPGITVLQTVALATWLCRPTHGSN